jgi:hypothetical protein
MILGSDPDRSAKLWIIAEPVTIPVPSKPVKHPENYHRPLHVLLKRYVGWALSETGFPCRIDSDEFQASLVRGYVYASPACFIFSLTAGLAVTTYLVV